MPTKAAVCNCCCLTPKTPSLPGASKYGASTGHNSCRPLLLTPPPPIHSLRKHACTDVLSVSTHTNGWVAMCMCVSKQISTPPTPTTPQTPSHLEPQSMVHPRTPTCCVPTACPPPPPPPHTYTSFFDMQVGRILVSMHAFSLLHTHIWLVASHVSTHLPKPHNPALPGASKYGASTHTQVLRIESLLPHMCARPTRLGLNTCINRTRLPPLPLLLPCVLRAKAPPPPDPRLGSC